MEPTVDYISSKSCWGENFTRGNKKHKNGG